MDGETWALSQNHKIVEVGRDLYGAPSSTPMPKQGHLEQIVCLVEEIHNSVSYRSGKYPNSKLVGILDASVVSIQQIDQCIFRTAKWVDQKDSTVT